MKHVKIVLISLICAIVICSVTLTIVPTYSYLRVRASLTKYLVYEVVPYGSLSSRMALSMFKDDLRKVVGSTDLSSYRFVVPLHSNYTLYLRVKSLIASGSKLPKDEILKYLRELESTSCIVVSKELRIIIHTYGSGEYIRAKVTLSFINGIATCGISYKPLPKVSSRWIKVGNHYIAKFKYLNITKELTVNTYTGASKGTNGEFLGDFIFKLGNYVLRSGEALIIYRLWSEPSLSIKESLYPLADVIYLNKVGNSLKASGIEFSNNYKGLPKGTLLMDERILRIPKELVSKLVRCRELIKAPPFIRHCTYNPSSEEFIKWSIDLSKLRRLCRFKVVKLGSTEYVSTYKGSKAKVLTTYYGIEVGSKSYVLELSPNLESMTYMSDGTLKEVSMKVFNGLLTPTLPSIITKTFGIGNEALVNAEEIRMELISK